MIAPVDGERRILIVNADDFGRSPGVNRGVTRAHENGIVTSASLMVQRRAAVEAAAYAHRHPELSVGIHIDLGEWVYRDGEWMVVEDPPESFDEEIRGQLALFCRLMGRTPSHIDSHQHVHREEPLASALLDLARELEVPLRGCDPRIVYCGDFYGQTAKGEANHDAISVEALLDLVTNLPVGVTELGCHPGLETDDDAPYGAERSMEVEALCDSRVRHLMADQSIELCSFTGLAR